jgi:predicted polyphosphate/ATP-dependent NAD kinase
MGEEGARMAGCEPVVLQISDRAVTTGADTRNAVTQIMKKGVALILFAGGDGTARDICSAVPDKVPVIGIPAGVKIHSPVFAKTPEKAGELAGRFLTGKVPRLREQEVLDIDEDAYRKGRVMTRLYGYLHVPDERDRMQNRKAGTPLSDRAAQNQIALGIIDAMEKDIIYLVGPGSTTRPILENLSLPFTLLGVDVICNRKILANDTSETDIKKIIKKNPFKIIVTPIGGQGYLFGRGNLQISPQIIQKAGKKNIIVAATPEKIASLRGDPFLIDSGDFATDQNLAGYIRVTTGYRQEMVYPVD